MKAVFVKGRNVVSVDEVQAPKMISKGDVLVKMRACGLCGSDLEKIYGEYGMSSGRLGHEPAGEVVAVGEGKYKEDGTRQALDVKAGDRVLFGKYSGSEIKIDGEELLIMREDEILGILERAGAASGKKGGK